MLVTNNKHLMTGSKENSEKTINVEGKQNLLFPAGSVIKCCYTSQHKKRKNVKSFALSRLARNLLRFQGARPDHVRIESYCFPGELVSFARPWELVSFDPRRVTRFPPITKRICVERYNK